MSIEYPPEAVAKIKALFPNDAELARALDSNTAEGWDRLNEKSQQFGILYLQISRSLFAHYRQDPDDD